MRSPAFACHLGLLTLIALMANCAPTSAAQRGTDTARSLSVSTKAGPDTNPSLQRWPLIPGETRGDSPGPMMPGRIYAPTKGPVSCPSQHFEEFFHAFLNNGDLQVAYTARPYILKGPYHLQYNTEPGDPANPQWETIDVHDPIHGYYRFNERQASYVSDISRLLPGQQWTGIDAYGKSTDSPVTQLEIRQVSPTEYAMHTPDRVTTFSKRADCWYLTHDWTLDPFEGCVWPEQCRGMREHEDGSEEN